MFIWSSNLTEFLVLSSSPLTTVICSSLLNCHFYFNWVGLFRTILSSVTFWKSCLDKIICIVRKKRAIRVGMSGDSNSLQLNSLKFVSWRMYLFPRVALTYYHKPGGLKQQKLIISVLESKSQKSQVVVGNTPSKSSWEEFFLASSSFWWLLGLRQHHSNLCFHLPALCLQASNLLLLSLIRTVVIGFRACLKSSMISCQDS